MKVLCPACDRLLPLERYALEGTALVVTCTGCGVATRVAAPGEATTLAALAEGRAPLPPAMPPQRVALVSTPGASNVVVLRTAGHEAVQKAAAAADEGPFVVPEGFCPRCLAARSGAAGACPHCGIDFARFDEAAALPPPWLREAWVGLLRDWGNGAAHAQLRRKAQQAGLLPAIGRLYRIRQAWVPGDPIAEEGRADIVRLASLGIGALPSTGAMEGRQRLVVGLAAVGLLLFLALLATRGLLRG